MSGRAPRASGRADSMRGGGRGRGYSSGPGFGGDARGGVHGVDRGSRGDRGGGRGTRGGSFQPRGYGGSRGGKLGDDQYTPGPIIYRGGGDSLPDTQVSAKEDEVVDSHKELNLSTLSLAEYQLPLRPGYGDSGTKIHLRTNYFNLTIDANKKIFKYTFTVQAERQKRDPETGKKRDPPKLPTARSRKMRQALALLFESQDFQNFNPGVATDYGTIIITSKSLNVGKEGVRKYEVVYQEPEDIQFHENPLVYTFTVSSAGIIPTPELLRYLASSTTDPSDWAGKKDAVQALNIIIARTPNFNNKVWQSGDNKFFEYPASSSAYSDLSGGLIAMRGYYSSVRTSTMRVLLNLNAQTSPFYPAIGLMQLMEQHGREPWQDLERFIFRLRVRTNYLKNKDGTPAIKVKTIVGFSHVFAEVTDPKTKKLKKIGNARGDRGSAEQITFECEEFGIGQMSVAAYYEKKHNIKLKFPSDWVLNCGTSDNPTWIPPELCEVMPGQSFRGKLSERQTTNILDVASRAPAENARRIIGDGQRIIGIQAPGNPALAAFGVTINSEMVVTRGRILAPPPVLYRAGATLIPDGASWNMRGRQFAIAKPMRDWAVLRLGNAVITPEQTLEFRQTLNACGLGLQVSRFPLGYTAALPGTEDANDMSIRNVLEKITKAGVHMLLVVLPTKNAATYNRVKFWADVKFGVHTVCVIADKLTTVKQLSQYFANVALKINQKYGGTNSIINKDKLGFLKDGDTMVVGYDVTHPAPGSLVGIPSIAGVVASIDGLYGQWPGSIRCQESKKEMVAELRLMMKERLQLWVAKNQRKPNKIIIFRDGVSEGQYKTVLEQELPQIRGACAEVYGERSLPKINVLVVGKRHHTRFYPTSDAHADRKGNPKNGTVVDRGITMEKGWDFYLQAHAALQGTARPAHYVVILDEMKLGANELEQVTHNLCYCYGRATKAVSICPPAYYADLLCERGRCYIAKYANARHPPGYLFDWNDMPWIGGVHSNLKDSMFYI